MNKIIILIVKGDDYNHTFKWNSVEDFTESLKNNKGIPKVNDIVIEAYIDDNLIDLGNTFGVTLRKMQMILGIM